MKLIKTVAVWLVVGGLSRGGLRLHLNSCKLFSSSGPSATGKSTATVSIPTLLHSLPLCDDKQKEHGKVWPAGKEERKELCGVNYISSSPLTTSLHWTVQSWQNYCSNDQHTSVPVQRATLGPTQGGHRAHPEQTSFVISRVLQQKVVEEDSWKD